MATATTTATKGSRFPWWLLLIEGILAVLVGLFLFIYPVKTFVAVSFFVGIWWFISGIFDIVSIFWDRSAWGWKLFMGIVSILAGGYVLLHPIIAGVALPQLLVLVLGIWGVIKGTVMFFMAFKGGGGAYAIVGIFAIFFGLILIAAYTVPGVAVMAIWIAALGAFIGGFFLIYRGLQQRKA
jgi:uncharacterized membrane protein HdeD (DUF308 family)